MPYRQRLRCSAQRTNGQACGNYAIHGGTVCTVHGGRAPQVRAAARRRLLERGMRRQLDVAWARYLEERTAWRADRAAVAAELLGLRPEDVTDHDIWRSGFLHGRPDPDDPGPDFRTDARFGPRTRPKEDPS